MIFVPTTEFHRFEIRNSFNHRVHNIFSVEYNELSSIVFSGKLMLHRDPKRRPPVHKLLGIMKFGTSGKQELHDLRREHKTSSKYTVLEPKVLFRGLMHASSENWKVLMHACELGNAAAVYELLQLSDLDVNQCEKQKGNTPLHIASYHGHKDVAELLLLHKKEIKLNEANNEGATPLVFASEQGHKDVVKLFLGYKGIKVKFTRSPPTARTVSKVILQTNKEGTKPFVQSHLGRNAIDVRKVVNNFSTMEKQQLSAFRSRYKNNGKYHKCQEKGDSSKLHSLLHISHGDWRVLMHACEMGDAAIVSLLLQLPKLDVNGAAKYGKTPLSVAFENGHQDVVKLLLGHPNIDPNKASNYGSTLLYKASVEGSARMVEIFLSHRHTKVNQSDSNGYGFTPLYIACREGRKEVVELLLRRKDTNVNQADKNNWTPLCIAAFHGHKDVVDLLLGHPDIAMKGKLDKESALHAHAYGDTTAFSKMDPKPALDFARSQGHLDIANAIENHMKNTRK